MRTVTIALALMLVMTSCVMATAEVVEKYDVIEFGRYEQDGDTANGMEPIEWIVLETDGNTALLISRYALDSKRFNEYHVAVTWGTSPLRKWLNSDFIDAAFDATEQAKLDMTMVMAEPNPEFSFIDPGKDTQDYVFLLSVNEAEKYLTSDYYEIIQPTAYAASQGEYDNSSAVNCSWWLRSPGLIHTPDWKSISAAYVSSDGSYHYDYVDSDNKYVRPAIVIRLDHE